MIFAEVASIQRSYSSTFYVSWILAILIVALTVFFIVRLRQGFKEIAKGVGISALITLIIEFVLFLFFSQVGTRIMCKLGADCPSPAEMSFSYVSGLFIPVLSVILFIYYLIKYLRRK